MMIIVIVMLMMMITTRSAKRIFSSRGMPMLPYSAPATSARPLPRRWPSRVSRYIVVKNLPNGKKCKLSTKVTIGSRTPGPLKCGLTAVSQEEAMEPPRADMVCQPTYQVVIMIMMVILMMMMMMMMMTTTSPPAEQPTGRSSSWPCRSTSTASCRWKN